MSLPVIGAGIAGVGIIYPKLRFNKLSKECTHSNLFKVVFQLYNMYVLKIAKTILNLAVFRQLIKHLIVNYY